MENQFEPGQSHQVSLFISRNKAEIKTLEREIRPIIYFAAICCGVWVFIDLSYQVAVTHQINWVEITLITAAICFIRIIKRLNQIKAPLYTRILYALVSGFILPHNILKRIWPSAFEDITHTPREADNNSTFTSLIDNNTFLCDDSCTDIADQGKSEK